MKLRTNRALLAALAVAAGVAASQGCSGYDDPVQTEAFSCPSRAVFVGGEPEGDAGRAAVGVSAFLERRCGTLDCHGQATRPMRLYGKFGLRHPTERNIPGGVDTTPAELASNYASVCTVEPENTAKAVDDLGQSAEALLVVRKARGIEAHKGGKVVNELDEGDRCLLGWLRGDPHAAVAAACEAAVTRLAR